MATLIEFQMRVKTIREDLEPTFKDKITEVNKIHKCMHFSNVHRK